MPYDSNAPEDPHYRVSFYTPLFEQRLVWILDILRRERVTQMLDVGCGEGALLEPLCRPSPWRLNPHTPSGDALPALLNHWQFAHMNTLHGLDICVPDLDAAIEMIASRPPNHHLSQIRWEDLECKMWHGGLQAPNAAFEGIDCIVATEVIEHLPPDILPSFAPVLLGCYHPRLFLITTPNYTFNQLFNPPDSTESGDFPDPTQRTGRIFRHPDHKFEWTAEECAQWCVSEAERWGYDVVVSGVGRLRNPDPWKREAATGFASQVACFRRKEGGAWTARRAEHWEEWRLTRGVSAGPAHELRATHHFAAHPSSGKPRPYDEVVDAVRATMHRCRQHKMLLRELWTEEAVATLCGGWFEVLVQAIDLNSAFCLRRVDDEAEDWKVELLGAEEEFETLAKEAQSDGDTDASSVWSADSDTPSEAAPLGIVEGGGSSNDAEGLGWGEVQRGWDTADSDGWGGSGVDGWGTVDGEKEVKWTNHT